MPEDYRPPLPPYDDAREPAPPRAWARWRKHWSLRLLGWTAGLLLAAAATVALLGLVALSMAWPNLPDISSLQNYQPKLPLRVFTSEGNLIGEFGEERRSYVPFDQIPKIVKDAVLAIEDARFYEHNGVDYTGVLRAGLANFSRARSQGASTITMQLARNVYLSSEKTFTRKVYEMLLAFKMEHALSKDQILEIYMNQIFLGNRAYGFAAASEAYFGKPLQDVNLAEAAMLAGLPKAPSLYNPIVNPARARARQLHILDRMVENGFVTPAQAQQAKDTPLVLRRAMQPETVHADYVSEMVRQLIYAQYGPETYTRGFNVYTTLVSNEQNAAYEALRKGILAYDARKPYRGPEHYLSLPADATLLDEAISEALSEHPDAGEMRAAVVLEASPKQVVVRRSDSHPITITGAGLRLVAFALSARASATQQIRRGAIVRIVQTGEDQWQIRQLPEVEGALVALDPRTGAIRSMAGGFDFAKAKFNHVTQALRQPGSSFKPFIYSAALESGISPSTLISDGALYFDASTTGGQPWSPKNYDGSTGAPLTLRRALAKSKNLVSVRVLQSTGTQKAQDWVARFGFPPERTPPYLTMALGASSTTPLELAAAYAVFANGGYAVNPYVISLITDQRGNVLTEIKPPALDEARRAIPARNAFIMNSLLHDVATSGTAAKSNALGRSDLYGKTGTTNDAKDAWFAGFQATQVAVVWMGYDTPRNLGARETGGGLSLPIWIDYMRTALKDAPVTNLTAKAPAGLVKRDDWYYEENANGRGIMRIDVSAYADDSGTDPLESLLQESSEDDPEAAQAAQAAQATP